MNSRNQISGARPIRVMVVVVMFLLILPLSSSPNDLSDEQVEAVRELLEVSGAAKLGQMMSQMIVGQMMRSLEAYDPNVADSGLLIVEEEINGLVAEELEPDGSYWNTIYPIYYKYFTLEEIRQLIAFNKTPIGQKVTATMPLMMQEITTVGMEWGKSLETELTKRIISRYLREQ